MRSTPVFVATVIFSFIISGAYRGSEFPKDTDDILRPYDGPSVKAVNPTTLTGKVMCGYQGWFTAKGDGAGKGWFHYERNGKFQPGHCSIDLWPDVSELTDSEKFATSFRHKDGTPAYVFSSHHQKTVLRHFAWMKTYGIDGVFVQRFGMQIIHEKDRRHCNVVLQHCREGANRHGRTYAVMYDLSGLRKGGVQRVIDDWKTLVDRAKIGRDKKDHAYLRHRGKPVVGVWGVGFSDNRDYTLDECERLIEFLKHDEKYGGNTVVIGVPAYWRTLDRDAVDNKQLHRIIRKADVVCPWSVGRYATVEDVGHFAKDRVKPDIAWCRDENKEYLPVVFPGFSWHNLNPKSRLNEISRLKGRFLWKQFVELKKADAKMIYVAMFDEMNEGTAIFKCTNNPPIGKSEFLTYEGLPTDHYLWLTGMGGRLLRGQIPITEDIPSRKFPKTRQ